MSAVYNGPVLLSVAVSPAAYALIIHNRMFESALDQTERRETALAQSQPHLIQELARSA